MRYLVGLEDKAKTIPLGRWGENYATEIAINVAAWISRHGEGTVTMWFKRSKDTDFYPATTTMDGTTAVHKLESGDMQYLGNGQMGVIYTNSDGIIVKSRLFTTVVLEAVESSETEPPAPYASWVTQVLEAASDAGKYATDSAQSATDAETAKEDAVKAKNETIQAKTDAVTAIREITNTALLDINTAGTDSVSAVTEEGNTQVQKVKDEGAEYQKQISQNTSDISNLKIRLSNLISIDGTALVIKTQ